MFICTIISETSVQKSEYLQGFDDVKIDTYYSSFNTYQIYTHYKLNIPNNDLRITKSGNYVISFFDEYGEELFQRKFILFENLSSVGIEIKRSRDLQFINEKQIVNFEINPRLSYFNRPEKNVKVSGRIRIGFSKAIDKTAKRMMNFILF